VSSLLRSVSKSSQHQGIARKKTVLLSGTLEFGKNFSIVLFLTHFGQKLFGMLAISTISLIPLVIPHLGNASECKPDASSLKIWGCKAWIMIPHQKRSSTSTTRYRRSQQGLYMGIAWPNPKAIKILLPNGSIQQSRHVDFDELAPPVCNSRADFSPFNKPLSLPASSSIPGQTSAVATPTRSSTPVHSVSQLSPTSPTDVQAHTDAQPASPSFLQENPIYESEEDPDVSMSPPIVAPRRSTRPNRGVPEHQPYGRILAGLSWYCQEKSTFSVLGLPPEPTTLQEALSGREAPH
jgi:hypothetical protein